MRVLFALILLLSSSQAWAGCTWYDSGCDQGEAISVALGWNGGEAECLAMTGPPGHGFTRNTPQHVSNGGNPATGYYIPNVTCLYNGNPMTNKSGPAAYYRGACTGRNELYPPGDKTGSAIPIPRCYGGCEILGTETSYGVGGIQLYGMHSRYYSGAACSAGIDANAPIDAAANQRETAKEQSKPECTAVGGGQTACQMPNGDYCATASNGVSVCWTPHEEGVKVVEENAQRKSEVDKPVTPPDVSIPDKDWQRKEGHQAQACINGNCKTYNITNYGTVAAGTAKNSTGNNNADGSGNTTGKGTGSGSGSGSGSGDGDGDSATDSGNCETPPVCVGDTLKCLQLRYTWNIECNTRGNEITNDTGCGEDIPVCAGKSCKAGEYSQVLQQWKQRCALEAMAEGNASRANGIDNGDDEGVVEGIWINQEPGTGPTLRTDLISVAGSGNLLPDVEIEGQAWNVPAGFYDAIAAIRLVIIAMCTVIAFFVVGRNI